VPNVYLSERTAREIDQRVAKLLADLGSPSPPLDLDQVRELLELDRQYYSSIDSGVVQEVIHHLTIGAKQVFSNPTRIIDAIRKRSLKALWLPERKRILIDESLPDTKRRWGEGHEIIHSLIPHHQVLTLGDPEYTLSPACHEQLETEANYGAGRLLFLRDEFRHRLLASPVTFESVKALADDFENSKTSTLWRAVETLDVPAIGLVSIHPWAKTAGSDTKVRHFIRSRRFATQFAGVTDAELFRLLAKVVHRRGGGLIGQKEVVLTDVDGREHEFVFECFNNTHDTLTLGMYQRARVAMVVAS
jgi:Zn-dependent peptidase ImmA (M78 family)